MAEIRLKDNVKKEVRDEAWTEDNIGLTATENERALKGGYRSFAIPGVAKADIDGYFD